MEDNEYAKNQVVIHTLLAQWWMARAITGEIKQRTIYHNEGDYGNYPSDEFTNEEKIANAIDTAKRHIDIIRDINDEIFGEGASEW